jgi:hypothetical protein
MTTRSQLFPLPATPRTHQTPLSFAVSMLAAVAILGLFIVLLHTR